MADQPNLTPREQQAVNLFDAGHDLDEIVRAMDSTNPDGSSRTPDGLTEGRVRVYVNSGLGKLGRGTMSQERGRKPRNGSSSTPTIKQPRVSSALAGLEAMYEQYMAQADALRTAITEAQAQADGFDAQAFVDARTQALTDAVSAAQAALDAWQADEAARTEAATQEQRRLEQRAQQVADANTEAADTASAEAEKLLPAIEALRATEPQEQPA